MIIPELEAAIDSVGRQRVFDYARAAGWSIANTPEPWVWWAIVNELRVQNRAPAATQTGGAAYNPSSL